MFNIYRKEIDFAGQKLVLETGKVARQADGCVIATLGGTSVLCAVTGRKSVADGQDFFPLSVHYVEKAYAAGKIPGGFFKREGRPSEKETLTSRLIDRPIRPLFPKGFLNEVQVVCTVVSHDMINDPDMVAMIGASAALTISGMPFMGPIAGTRVGYKDGEFMLNPTIEEMLESDLDLVVAGTQEGVLMVESEAEQLSEDIMLDAVMFGWRGFQPVIDAIIDLAEMAAKEPWDLKEEDPAIKKLGEDLKAEFAAPLAEAYKEQIKLSRQEKVSAFVNRLLRNSLTLKQALAQKSLHRNSNQQKLTLYVVKSSKLAAVLMVVKQLMFAQLLLKLVFCHVRMAPPCSHVVKHRRLLLQRLAQVQMNK